jgi:2-polyprenyl-6-methoxyphenol hydroxylase-like FAD-dependent oxidoreductase
MLLARKGYRVLIVDRATFPSDVLSTHVVHPPGAAALARRGLLVQMNAGTISPAEFFSPENVTRIMAAGEIRTRS